MANPDAPATDFCGSLEVILVIRVAELAHD
jgi:hypothetical protein